jgi:hypothetical protein
MSHLSQTISIGPLDQPRCFTLSEARELLPTVVKITKQAESELYPFQFKLRRMLIADPRRKSVEARYELVVRQWADKLRRLGLVVEGLWEVDFDTGEGYLSWHYPEIRIGYYREYYQRFDQRRSLDEVIDELDPDWAHFSHR